MATAEAPSRAPEDLVDATGTPIIVPATAEIVEPVVATPPPPDAVDPEVVETPAVPLPPDGSEPVNEAIAEPGVPQVENSAGTPTETLSPEQAARAAEIDASKGREMERKKIYDDLKSVFELVAGGTVSDDEMMQWLAPWVEKYAGLEGNLNEILDYFELTKEIIDDNFSPEDRITIATTLVENIADGTFDAETMQALSFKVIYGGPSNDPNKVCEYKKNPPMVLIFDEFLEKNPDGKYKNKIRHILSHEVSHGLSVHGGVGHTEEVRGRIAGTVGNATSARSRETFRSVNAIDQYLAVLNKPDATDEEKSAMAAWLSEELLAEKIAAYLQSVGDFQLYQKSVWNVTPKENRSEITKTQESWNTWQDENKFFFLQIKKQMEDKEALKAKILSSTEESRNEIGDNDFDEILAGGHFNDALSESGAPEKNSNDEGFWQMVVTSFKEVAEGSREVTDVVPGSDVKV